MLNLRLTLLAGATLLAGCYSAIPRHKPKAAPPPVTAQASFQFGQTANVLLDASGNTGLQQAFQQWVRQGVYTQTPVYRQLPGVFVLTGKPRLAGQGFVMGTQATLEPKQKKFPEAKAGEAGLIIHADGTVGPELILIYGHSVTSCCEAPQNIRIGKITSGKSALKSVQRGDNLQSIAIIP